MSDWGQQGQGGGFPGQGQGGYPPAGGGYPGQPGGGQPGGAPPGGGQPAPWSAIDAVTFGFNWTTKDIMGVLVPPLALTGAMVAVFLVAYVLLMVVMFAVAAVMQSDTMRPIAGILMAVLYLSFFAFGLVIASWAVAGMTRFAQGVARGQKPALSVIFSGADGMVPMMGWFFFLFVGMVLCYLPGLVFGFLCGFAPHFIIDKRMSLFQALQASYTAVMQKPVDVFVYVLVVGLLQMVGGVCAILALVTTPTALIAGAYVYLRMTGQNVAPAPTT